MKAVWASSSQQNADEIDEPVTEIQTRGIQPVSSFLIYVSTS